MLIILHLLLLLAVSAKVVVITGGSSGIGYEIAKKVLRNSDYTVVITCHKRSQGEQAVHSLDPAGIYSYRLHQFQLEINSPQSVDQFKSWLIDTVQQVHILVNGIAVNPEGWDFSPDKDFPLSLATEVLQTNFFSQIRLTEALFPIMQSPRHIINITSKLGKLEVIPSPDLRKKLAYPDLTQPQLIQIAKSYLDEVAQGTWKSDRWPRHNYLTSKVLFSAYTRVIARDLQDKARVNAVCPGWSLTKIGGPHAPITAEEAAITPTLLVMSNTTDTGNVWEDGKVTNW